MIKKLINGFQSGDKSLITNSLALVVIFLSFIIPGTNEILLAIGLFALSGALTNWLAIYMLFEKVPFMYGSGVIPNRFEDFKATIKSMIMSQFFNEDNLKKFITTEEASIANWLKPGLLVDKIDYNRLFDRLVEAIMASSFGGMLSMMGGAAALQGLKDSFIEKIKMTLNEMVQQDSFKAAVASSIDADTLSHEMAAQIEMIVEQRLAELTPQLVKEIVQQIIKEHLGWLVVWGGVVGAIFGLIAGLML